MGALIVFPGPRSRETRRAWRDRCAAFEEAVAEALGLRG